MEPEKFLTPAEFNSLLKAAKDDRERCILLLLAGAGLRVGEMTQIRAEDVDFTKGFLHIEASNAKDTQRAGCSEVITLVTSPLAKSRTFSIASPPDLVSKRSNAQIRQANNDTAYILTCSGTALPFGVSIVACQLAISKTSLGMHLWLPQAFISKPARTTGERRICGRGYRTVSQVRRLEDVRSGSDPSVADGLR